MIKRITSKENRIFKEYKKLLTRKYRDSSGMYMVEGDNLAGEALTIHSNLTEAIIISEDYNGKFSGDFLQEASENTDVYSMEKSLFDKLAQTETSQGIIAVIRKRELSDEELALSLSDGKNIAVLDRLQDPGNIGTIIRTAEGAGYGLVAAIRGTADIYSPKTIRAAAGSVFRIPVVHVRDNRELTELCRKLGKKIAVTAMDAEMAYFDADISEDTALVIGNEGRGVSEELMEMADLKISIPMAGKLESLNASVAAGILMYEAQRKKK